MNFIEYLEPTMDDYTYSEPELKKELVRICKQHGFWRIKNAKGEGMPDWTILCAFNRKFYVELKSTGEKPTKRQEFVISRLRSMGFTVYVIDTMPLLYEVFEYEIKESIKSQKMPL